MLRSRLCLLFAFTVVGSCAYAQTSATKPLRPSPRQPATPAHPARSWRDYWKAAADRAAAAEPDAATVIHRADHARPYSGNLGTETAVPFFSGSDTTFGFANSFDLYAGVQRQADCSLSELIVGPTSSTNATSVLLQSIPKFDRYLDTISGITTGGVFANGCADPATDGVLEQVVSGGAVTGGKVWAGYDFYSPTLLHTGVLSSSLVSTPATINLTNDIYGMLAADFNGDGKPDLAVLTNNFNTYPSPGQIAILINNGDGTFKPPVFLAADYNVSGLVAGKFNSAGHVDLIATAMKANGDWETLYYTNNGSGVFSAPASTDTGTTEKLVYLPVDINKDGTLDVIAWDVTGGAAQLEVLLNNGSAAFTSKLGYTSSNIAAMAAGDLNNDGKLDLVLTNNYANSLTILKGAGDGTFTTQATYPAIYAPTAAYITDLDGDGNQDIVIGIAGSGFFGPTYGPKEDTFGQFLLGNGDFTFSTPAPLAAFTSGVALDAGPGSFTVAKLNADAYPDMAVYGRNTSTGTATVSTFLGSASSAITNGTTTTFTLQSLSLGYGQLAAVDLNGDSHPDLLITGTDLANSSTALQAALNNGSGTFTPVSTVLDLPAPLTWMATGDFNGDKKQDVAFVLNDSAQGPSNGLYIALGNGNGTFQAPVLVDSAVTAGLYLVSADINGDGNADLVAIQDTGFGNVSSVFVYLGNGNGTFSLPNVFDVPDGDTIRSAIVADFNGDGKLDLALIGLTGLYVYSGNKTANFTYVSTTDLQDEGAGYGVAADFNQDGKMDIVTDGCCGLAAPQLLLGKGDGTFQPGLVFGSPQSSYGVAALAINNSAYTSVVFGDNNQMNNNLLNVAVNHYANAPSLTKAATKITVPSTLETTQGEYVQVQCTVAEVSGGGQPTGTVTATLGSITASAQLGSGTCYVSPLIPTSMAAGTYTLTIAYSGDAFNQPSSATVSLQVENATALALAATNPIPQGSKATLTATLTRPYATGHPTGEITFFAEGGNLEIGTAPLVNGVATLSAPTTGIPAGVEVLQAGYYTASTTDSETLSSLVPVTIVPAGKTGTRTTLALSPSPITVGQTAILTASVVTANGSAVTSGAVTLSSTGGLNGVVGTFPLNSKGQVVVSASTASLYAYPYNLTAVYNGTATYYKSQSPVLNFYLRPQTTLAVQVTPNSLTPGEPLILSATVSRPGFESPTGVVQFFADGVAIGSAPLNSAGVALLTLPTNGQAAGVYSITASYGGDEFDGASKAPAASLRVK